LQQIAKLTNGNQGIKSSQTDPDLGVDARKIQKNHSKEWL
jgi:hypothetical protein